ncbi:MAG: glycosyltransferase family 87 protein [Chitinophagaceae bacterium]
MKTYTKFLYKYLIKLVNNRKVVLILWFGAAFYGAIKAITNNYINNYIIFKHVYFHTVNSTNLYLPYPAEYSDVNLYGPFFSLIIAPFTYLPDKAGILLWVMANAFFLFFAISKLPVSDKWKNIMLLLSLSELITTSVALETNALVCACIMLGFSYTKKEKDIWALFFIVAAAFIKIYGIAGLAFFIFSKKKLQFAAWAIAWSVLFFFAPIAFTSFNFLVQSYADWYDGLTVKGEKNIGLGQESLYQNISLLGMIRRIFYLPQLNDALILIPAFFLFVSQYMRYKFINDTEYQLYILCSVLLSIVLFSTGSESPTYIIAIPAMILWYLLQPKTKWVTIFFIIAFLFTTFTYSDIFTPWARTHLSKPYSLKAFFPFVIWMIILVQIHIRQFLKAMQSFGPMKLAKT